jgi:hypothetical protein
MFILICLIVFLIYISLYKKKNKYKNKDNELLLKINELQNDLKSSKNDKSNNRELEANVKNKFLDKIYNPLAPPENLYPNGTLNSPGYDAYSNYQMLGYLTGTTGQYPVFGRNKYPGKSDKVEYYAINEGRNKIKIPFKTTNYNELYDGDPVVVNEIGGDFIFKKYENEGIRYNPNAF